MGVGLGSEPQALKQPHVFVCMHIHKYTYVYMYICICICIYTYAYMRLLQASKVNLIRALGSVNGGDFGALCLGASRRFRVQDDIGVQRRGLQLQGR